MLLQALDHTLRPSRLACSPVPPFKWPQIFVIGGVGVGKSSVVKRLLVGGVEVPVGVDCVTRRPTQFVPPTMEAESDSETVTASSLTATLVSQHSAEALQVPCPSAPTVIWDFPGLTQMPRPGQPDNIHQLVQDGIRQRYRPGDLLIAVVAGSEDFANAEVINLAKELDPMGGHTVFVVTKLDLSSSGVAANIDGGFGGVFGEPRAVVCVRNCGFAEQDQDADALERAFFSTNQAAAAITGKWGISALAQEITAIVAEQARAHYVHHQQSLERTLAALKAKHLRLSQPGYPVFLLTRYLGHLEGVLEGRWSAEAAAIGYAFGYELPAALEAIEPVTGIPARELHILFKNSKGLKQATPFSSNRPFQTFVREELRKYEKVIDELFAAIVKHMEGIILIGKIDEESGEAFFDAQTDLDLGISFRPEVGGDDNEALKIKNELVAAGMAQAINNCALQVIKANADRAIGFIRDLLAIESDHICTNDPLFWRECQRHLRAESNNTSNNNSNGQVRRASDVPVEEIEISNSNSATEKEGSALDDFLALFRPTASIRRAAAKTLPRPLQQPVQASVLFSPPPLPKADPIMEEELQFTLAVLKSYLGIVRRSLADSVPKAIAHFLIRGCINELPRKLLPLTLNNRHSSFANCSELEKEIGKLSAQIAQIEDLLLNLLQF